MRLGHIELFAHDVAATRDFYCRFFGCEPVVDLDGGRLSWVKSGDIEFLIRPSQEAPAGKAYGDSGPALVFYTSDLPDSLARLAKAGVEQMGCDGRDCCPLFRDPDGTWIQLVDPKDQG